MLSASGAAVVIGMIIFDSIEKNKTRIIRNDSFLPRKPWVFRCFW